MRTTMARLRWFMAGLMALALLRVAGAASAQQRDAPVPPAPDYADARSWAALPGMPSGADALPRGVIARGEASSDVDVFFIHPTTFLSRKVGNAAYDAGGIARLAVDQIVLRFQAGAFNGCCRIFVPRYRQASVASFFQDGPDTVKAIEFAYSDVLRAFDDFIAHRNEGRPFILASHSQGSIHAMRLLQQRIIGGPLQQRMVAAYVIGYAIPEEIGQRVPICTQARQTGCLIHWASVTSADVATRASTWIWLDNRYQPLGRRRLVCVNPLNWERDASAAAAMNLGTLPKVFPGAPLPKPWPAVAAARCDGGQLVVTLPFWAAPRFRDLLTLFGSYHDFDYHLFYMNLRQNASDRAAAFLARR